MIRFVALLALISIVAAASAQIHPFSARKGLVVSDSAIASEVGAEILRKGGNAVDAGIATGFALAVTFPAAGNIGGGGFMVVRLANGVNLAIDYREMAPAKASREMYLDEAGNVIPGRSTVGRWAAGVPGTTAGFYEAHHLFGSLPWADLVEPAIKLARDGFPVSRGLAGSLQAASSKFKPFSDSYRIFCRNGDHFKEGDILIQSDLAKTLTRIRDNGRNGFYEGETARLFAEDADRHEGPFTLKDFSSYIVKARRPLTGTYKGHEIITMPPPSSGGAALIQMLNMLESHNIRRHEPNSAAYVHRLTETMKRAFADRAEHMGDPDFNEIPVGPIIDKKYANELASQITNRATPSIQIKAGEFAPNEGESTTHFSVVDSEGNAVSNTYTLNTGFGSLVVAEGTGVLLNNEMDDFTSRPGTPNTYGLIQGEKNSIEPMKRPLSSMTPTIVTKNDKLFMVTGSPGGPTIINTVMHSILNVIEHGMTIQEAVAFPRFHHQWMPDRISWEPFGLSPETRLALGAMGHVFDASSRRMGSCHAILAAPDGRLLAGVDPRVSTAGAAGAD
jgi:gamma-glutamyltranspeptidase/glutathione hydrolase